MAPPAKLFSSEKDLPSHFTSATRVHISEFTTADQKIGVDRLQQFVHEHCIEREQPLVIGGMNTLPQWDHDLFALSTLEDMHKDEDLTFLDMKSYDLVKTTVSDYLKNHKARPDNTLSGSGSTKTTSAVLYGKDLTCPAPYHAQLKRLLPEFLLPLGTQDCFGSMPTTLRAENLMIYVGGPHTGTPLHRDLCGTYGHNLMLTHKGNAYAEWYLIPHKHRDRLLQVIQQPSQGLHGVSQKKAAAGSGFIESDRAWVSKSKLISHGIPTQVILQRPGDLVLIPSLCYHQVRNSGVTTKIAWNRATPHSLYRAFSQQLPVYQSIVRPEIYRCKAMVFFVIRDWTDKFKKAKDLCADEIRTLPPLQDGLPNFLTACRRLIFIYLEYIVSSDLIEPVPREHVGDNVTPAADKIDPFMLACDFCRGDIFDRYYFCSSCKYELCLKCYSQGRGCPHFYALTLQQSANSGSDYLSTYLDFIKATNDILTRISAKAQLFDESSHNQLPRSKTYSTATTCRRIENYRKNNGPFCNWLRCGHCRQLHSLRWIYDTYGLDLEILFSRRLCIDVASPLEDNIVYTCVECSASCIACPPLVPKRRGKYDKVYYLSPDVEKRNWGGATDTDVPLTMTWPHCSTDEIKAMVESEQDGQKKQECLKDYILQVLVERSRTEKVCAPQIEVAQEVTRALETAASATAEKFLSMGWARVKDTLTRAPTGRFVMDEDSNLLTDPYVDLDNIQFGILLAMISLASIPGPNASKQSTQPKDVEQTRIKQEGQTRPKRTVRTWPKQVEETQSEQIEGIRPRRTARKQPKQTEETRPRRTARTQPKQTEETRPRRTARTQPKQTEETRLEQIEETRPRRTVRIQPKQTEDIRPVQTDRKGPSDQAEKSTPVQRPRRIRILCSRLSPQSVQTDQVARAGRTGLTDVKDPVKQPVHLMHNISETRPSEVSKQPPQLLLPMGNAVDKRPLDTTDAFTDQELPAKRYRRPNKYLIDYV